MGEQRVRSVSNISVRHQFIQSLLEDMEALDHMLTEEWFETSPIRIGAEQELCLVNQRTFKPATTAMEVLSQLKDLPWLESELASFNLEINLDPREFSGSCLSDMEKETSSKLQQLRTHLNEQNTDLVLTGILPTLRKYHLDRSNLTPKERYRLLIDAIDQERIGHAYELRLRGIDELLVKHDSPLMEACNTSFQVHLQTSPADFVHWYNIAQALAAPVMAIAANSPIVFGRRLWHESRIALFQQALDVRTTHDHMRERSPRVSFGNHWLNDSIMEIYREDIARFRVLLSCETEEKAMERIRRSEAPKLRALQVHNGTVYRWNRPCYGISPNGKPHLRIENRVLPAGPTVTDEIANAAFWLGALTGYAQIHKDIRPLMDWEDVRDNFGKAARTGIDSKFTWFKEQKVSACDLILQELLPIAREGLTFRNLKSEDIDNYLGIIEERAKKHINGAHWQLKAYNKLLKETSRDEALSVLTHSIIDNQNKNKPVHEWKSPKLDDLKDYRPAKLRVEEFMETDLFTVQKEDLIDLVARLMDWRQIRYMPVEDTKGNLSGLITMRLLLRHFTKAKENGQPATLVKDIMVEEPITISPNATITEAMQIMRSNKIGCLPVTQHGELIGIITEMDFLRISSRLIERLEE